MSGGRTKLPREHGTTRGYAQHRYDGTNPCEPCREAESVRRQRRPDDRRAGELADRRAARDHALTLLRRRHASEFQRLYQLELDKRGLRPGAR